MKRVLALTGALLACGDSSSSVDSGSDLQGGSSGQGVTTGDGGTVGEAGGSGEAADGTSVDAMPGELLWLVTETPGPNLEGFWGTVTMSRSGDYFIGGVSLVSETLSPKNLILRQFTATAQPGWNFELAAHANSSFSRALPSILGTADGGLIACGVPQAVDDPGRVGGAAEAPRVDFDAWVAKFDLAGTLQWDAEPDIPDCRDFCWVTKVVETARDEFVLLHHMVTGGSVERVWLHVYDATGARIHTHELDLGQKIRVADFSVLGTGSRGFALVGTVINLDEPESQGIWVAGLDDSFSMRWSTIVARGGRNQIAGTSVHSDETGIWVTGQGPIVEGGAGPIFARLSHDGVIAWEGSLTPPFAGRNNTGGVVSVPGGAVVVGAMATEANGRAEAFASYVREGEGPVWTTTVEFPDGMSSEAYDVVYDPRGAVAVVGVVGSVPETTGMPDHPRGWLARIAL